MTTALDAPRPPRAFNAVRLGRGGPVDHAQRPRPTRTQCLRVAAAELIASADSGQPAHPCDVRFGRDIVAVLAEAEAQLASRGIGHTFTTELDIKFR